MSKAIIMLAKMATPKLIDPNAVYTISEKLDGQPVDITWNHDTRMLEAKSRQGKIVTSINHILADLDKQVSDISLWIGKHESVVGELYIKGLGSAEISGKVRKDELCEDLVLYLFPEFQDTIDETPNVKYIPYRLTTGDALLLDVFNDKGEIKLSGILQDWMDEFCINKSTAIEFEGYIARKDGDPWIAGKRSNNYLKIIEDPTMDMMVVDLIEAKTTKDKFDEDDESPTFEEILVPKGTPLGRVGAFIVKWGNGTCKVGSGKMSHNLATDAWNAYLKHGIKEGLPSTIIEVKYKKDAKYTSPRQPTFQRFRFDKDTYETAFPND